MQEMLVIGNPRRKRRRKGGRKRRKMSALQRRYFGKGRRSAPVRRRRRRSRSVALAAPRVHRRRSRRHRTRVTRVRRNPSMRMGGFNIGSFMRNNLMPAGIGAIGAIGVDVALGYVNPMLPASLQSGLPRTAVRIAGAVVVGMIAGKVMGRKFGEDVTAGAITVTLYDLIKGYVAAAVPGLALSEYNMGWIAPGLQVGEYVGADPIGSSLPGLSEYVGEYEPGGQYAYGT